MACATSTQDFDLLDLSPQLRPEGTEVVGCADVTHVQPAAERSAFYFLEIAGFGRFKLAAMQVDAIEPQFSGAGDNAEQIDLAGERGVSIRKRLKA